MMFNFYLDYNMYVAAGDKYWTHQLSSRTWLLEGCEISRPLSEQSCS